MGDDSQIAVRARSRGAAKAGIAAYQGCDFVDVRVSRRFMRPCGCDECVESGPMVAHGFDVFYDFCEGDDPGAEEWWVEQW
jgi:hypothetical protein